MFNRFSRYITKPILPLQNRDNNEVSACWFSVLIFMIILILFVKSACGSLGINYWRIFVN